MRLAWVVPCDSYEFHNDGTVDIFRAGVDTLYVDRLPALIRICIVGRVVLGEADGGGVIEVEVRGPDTKSLSGNELVPFRIVPNPPPNHRPGHTISQPEVFKIGGIARQAGYYSVEFYFEGERANPTDEQRNRSVRFAVIEGAPE